MARPRGMSLSVGVSTAACLVLAGTAAFAQPGEPPAPLNPVPAGTPVWRASLDTKFYPLSLDDAIEKASREVKLVVVYLHTGVSTPAMDKTWRNPTLAPYLEWRRIPVAIDVNDERDALRPLQDFRERPHRDRICGPWRSA